MVRGYGLTYKTKSEGGHHPVRYGPSFGNTGIQNPVKNVDYPGVLWEITTPLPELRK